MKLKTNEVSSWIVKRIEPIKEELGIKTIMQGDFTSLPAPEEIDEWCNILIIKPTSNQIASSSTDYMYKVSYNIDLYYLRKINQDEPINASLVDATEQIAESLFFNEDIDEDDRFRDGDVITEALPRDIDYDSDVEGLLRALQLDITASKINWSLTSEQGG